MTDDDHRRGSGGRVRPLQLPATASSEAIRLAWCVCAPRSLALVILLALSRTAHPRPAFPAAASLFQSLSLSRPHSPRPSPLLLLLCYVRHSPERGGRAEERGRADGGKRLLSPSFLPSLSIPSVLPQQPRGTKSLTTDADADAAAAATESTKRRRKEGREEGGRTEAATVS